MCRAGSAKRCGCSRRERFLTAEDYEPKGSRWDALWLAGILAMAAAGVGWGLWRDDFGNTYYAAGVRSMLLSWHNFFFLAFDPTGFLTIDKPPLGLWLQVASAKAFGFHPWSVVLPQAVAAVLAAAVLYQLVERGFGAVAARIAAFALAITPIWVVTARNNTMDSVLALTMLLAVWAGLHAIESGRLGWLLLAAVLLGLGFNVKSMEALLVLPALVLAYLVGARQGLARKVLQLVPALIVLAAVSLPWVLAVDAVPGSQRPYIASTTADSELELLAGYNGLGRVIGSRGVLRVFDGAPLPPSTSSASQIANLVAANPQLVSELGRPGPLRLLNLQLAGQLSWQLPLALFGLGFAAWQAKGRQSRVALTLWGVWLLTEGLFFSFAVFYHRYYLVTMAPAAAALFGIGLAAMWRAFKGGGLAGWLLPLALLAEAAFQLPLIPGYADWTRTLAWAIVLVTGVGAVVLAASRLPAQGGKGALRLAAGGLTLGVLGQSIAPGVWAAIPVLDPYTALLRGEMPYAGPLQPGLFGQLFYQGFDAAGAVRRFDEGRQGLDQFLLANRGRARYLLVAQNALLAGPVIIDTGQPVLSIGGFLGTDTILSQAEFVQLMTSGAARYFQAGLIPGGPPSPPDTPQGWVVQHCRPVRPGPGQPLVFGLFDCGGSGSG